MAIVIDNRVFEPRDHSFIERGLQLYGKTYFQLAEMMDKILEDNGKYKLPESWKEGNEVQDGFFALFNPAADDFAQGMTSLNVNALLNSRRYYREKMVPLHEAVDRYNTILDLITRGGEDTIVGNASDLTIDLIYKNGALHSPLRTISRQSVVKGAQLYFKGIDSLLLSDPTFKSIMDNAAEGWLYSSQLGFDPKDILTMALSDYVNNSNSPESDEVRKYLDSYIKGLGTEGFDEQGKSRTRGAALEGMVDAFQTSRNKVVQDLRPKIENMESQMNRRAVLNQLDTKKVAIQEIKAQNQASGKQNKPEKLKVGDAVIDGKVYHGRYNGNQLIVTDPNTGAEVSNEIKNKFIGVSGMSETKPTAKTPPASKPPKKDTKPASKHGQGAESLPTEKKENSKVEGMKGLL